MAAALFDRQSTAAAAHPVARTAIWLGGALAAVSAATAAITVLEPGVLRGVPVLNGNCRGTALVVLAAGAPTLALAVAAAARGSRRALVVWLGAGAFLLYQAVLFLFATPFNQLFLFNVAMLSLAIWSPVALLHRLDVAALSYRRLPRRALALYVGAIASLNFLAWMRVVLPDLASGRVPDFVRLGQVTNNPIYIQDLAFWIPLMALAATLLWRGAAWGRLLAGAILVFGVLETVSIGVDQWFGSAADPASALSSASVTTIALPLALVELVPLYFYMRALRDR